MNVVVYVAVFVVFCVLELRPTPIGNDFVAAFLLLGLIGLFVGAMSWLRRLIDRILGRTTR